MKILAINSGSSSLKFKLFEVGPSSQNILATGEFKHYSKNSYTFKLDTIMLGTSSVAIDITKEIWDVRGRQLFESLFTASIIESINEIDYVAHRVVHGGEKYTKPTVITQDVIEDLEENFNDLAPLHNPAQIKIIKEIFQRYPETKQIAIFDTAFNSTIPKENYLYALPIEYYEKFKVRRYGFHGISHKFVSSKIKDLSKKEYNKIISCHLGSGSSICAIKDNLVVDNSFGFSPNENLVTSTRVGEVDFDALVFLKKKLGLLDTDIEEIISKKSGLLGISGYTQDMKVILKDKDSNKQAGLAFTIFINQIVSYISKYIVMMNGIDVLIFTGGIGSGSDVVRKAIVDKLQLFGIDIDESVNNGAIDIEDNLNITAKSSRCDVFVIHTDEEMQMVEEVFSEIRRQVSDIR